MLSLCMVLGCMQESPVEPRRVVASSYALSQLVQSAASGTSLSSSLSASFASTPTSGNLLIAIASSPSSQSSMTGPSGWSVAINNATSSPSQVIYYKVAGASESKTVSVSFTFLSLVHALRILEFSGFDGKNAPVTASKTGSSVSQFAFPAVTTTAPSALVLAASFNTSLLFTPGLSSWSNSFTDLTSYSILLTTDMIAAAYLIADTAGSYTTTSALTLSASVIGQTVAFNRLPPALSNFAVSAGAGQNLLTFSSPADPVSHVMILAKTTDCSFSATPTGSEARGATVGNATLIFNDAPTASLTSKSVTVSGVTTSVAFDTATRTLTHSTLTAGTLYCYRIIARNGLALDVESASPKTRSATPYATSATAPQFIVNSGSTTLSAASIIPGTGALYADSAGQLLTVGTSGVPAFAQYQLPDAVQSRMPVGTLGAETDTTAFISALDGDVYAVWASGTLSGTLRWSSAAIDGNSSVAGDQALGAALYASPLVSNALSRVYVSTRNATTDSNRIFALNAATGACVWVLNGSCSGATSTLNIGQISAVPLLDATNYRLLFTSLLYNAGSTVWAVDAHDSASGNRVLWSRNLGSIDSSLTFTSASRDAVLVGTNAGRIYKLDPSDGTTCWGQTSDGCAHAATGTEQFFCTDPAVNARATSCTNGAAIQKSLVPVNGTFLGNVVFSTTDGYVRMINSQGAQVWRTLVSGASTPLPLPSVSSGKVYVGGSDGLVHELSLSDGTQTGTRSVGGGTIVASAPAYDSTTGTLHLNTSQGSQYGFSVPF